MKKKKVEETMPLPGTITLEMLYKEIIEIKKEIRKKNDQISGHVEVIQKLIDTNMPEIEESVKSKPDKSDKSDKSDSKPESKLKIQIHEEDKIKIYGKTYDYRSHIKEAANGEAIWSNGDKSWIMPASKYDNLINLLSKNNIDFITQDEEIIRKKSITITFNNNEIKFNEDIEVEHSSNSVESDKVGKVEYQEEKT